LVTLKDIKEAESRIGGKIIRTPLIYSPTFSTMSGAEVWLKLESMQKAGSFKVRGAVNRILASNDIIGPAGVIAASAGNHAQGVAVAAGMAGVPATIVMPEWTSLSKQEASRGYGARVILAGTSLEESIDRAKELAGTEGMVFIHPYDDPAVIAGQGTIGLEILADLPEVDRVLVPVGGGGLISGIAVALRELRRSARVIGVQAAACPSARASREEGGPVTVEAGDTIADGIRVKRTGTVTFPLIRELVEDVVLVEEREIQDAVLLLLERKKVLAEGAGAVPLAALLSGAAAISPGEKVVLVISGGNVDTFLLERILKRGLFDSGRMARFAVLVETGSRSLPALLEVISTEGGVISGVNQDRDAPDVPLHQMRVRIEIETRGPDHRDRILSALDRSGYRTS
jgi:threonine dehydratase